MDSNPPPCLWLGLGSNLGNRQGQIKNACTLLHKRGLPIHTYAPLYATDPLGFEDQPEFINTIVGIHTDLNPIEVLSIVKQIEQDLGRKKRHHWGPREIDIDIVLFKDTIFDSPELQIPHPEMGKREFVLLPLAEVAPQLKHPLTGKTIQELLKHYYGNLQRDQRRARLFAPAQK